MPPGDFILAVVALAAIGMALWAMLALTSAPVAVQTAPDGAVVIVEGGRIVSLADEARALLGPVSGEPLAAVIRGHFGAASAALSAVDRLLRTGQPMQLLAEDSTGRLVELVGRPDGGRLRLVLRDASLVERRLAEAEQRLAEREARLETELQAHRTLMTLLDAAPVAAWCRDADGPVRWSGGAIPAPWGKVAAARVAELAVARAGPAAGGAGRRLDVAGPGDAAPLPLQVFEAAGAGGEVVGVAVDGSAASAAERTLSRFVQTMTETFAHLSAGLAIFDRNQTLTLFNPAVTDMWGIDAAWLARRPTMQEILERLRATRRIPETDDFHAWRQRLLDLFDDPERASYEEVWHLADSTGLQVIARPHPHGSLALVFEDVTERIRLEQRFRHLIDLRRATLDRLDEGVAVFGPDGTLLFVNSAFHEIWGTGEDQFGARTQAAQVVGMCRAASVESDVWQRLLAFVTADSARHPWTSRITLSSGRILNVRVASLPDSSSLAVFIDVTAAERIAQALRERNEALESAEQLRTAVLDQISRRLRGPLNLILSFANLLAEPRHGALGERQAEFVDSLLAAVREMQDKIDEVTELAALQLEPMLDGGDSQPVWDALDAAHALLLKRAIEGGVVMTVDEPPDFAAGLTCEVPNLRQIVFTVLADALQRARPGGQIGIGARADGDTLEIRTVESGGAGGGAPTRPELGRLTRALLHRMMTRCRGTFEVREEGGLTHSVCRFPRTVAPPDPEEPEIAADDPPELDLPPE